MSPSGEEHGGGALLNILPFTLQRQIISLIRDNIDALSDSEQWKATLQKLESIHASSILNNESVVEDFVNRMVNR